MKNDAPRIFEPEYYDRLAEVEVRHWWSRGMLALTRDLLVRFAPEGRLLDAGCGTGGQLGCLPSSWKRRSFELQISAAVLVLEGGTDTGPDAFLQAFALDDRGCCLGSASVVDTRYGSLASESTNLLPTS